MPQTTGQDQAATVKRQLQALMPRGLEVFLDVDDLRDISMLEKHVKESATLLVFLSRG